MASSSSLLVSYGTLMRAFGRQEKLGVKPSLTFVSTCQMRGRLYDLGLFPGAVPGPGVVHGELFRLDGSDVLRVLDRYEGYDSREEEASLFIRRQVSLRSPHEKTAWVYWYNGDVDGHPRVPSGDWEAYTRGDRSS